MNSSRSGGLGQVLRDQIWLALIIVVLAVNSVIVWKKFFAPPTEPAVPLASVVSSTLSEVAYPGGFIPSPLNGAAVSATMASQRAVAVMVDNLVSARPQIGLSQASIVWETLVEGGITRFLAVLSSSSSSDVGPVRSARDYFVPLVKEVDALYAHSGGSPAGLSALKADASIDDADEFTNGSAYYRTSSTPPHNLYLTPSRLFDLAVSKGWHTASNVTPWSATPGPLIEGDRVSKVTINFSSLSAYRVQWRYDDASHQYLRSQGGAMAVDRATQQQLKASNVIIEFTKVTPAAPPAPPEAVTVATTGSGTAWFLRDGRLIKGRWEKPSGANRTKFLLPDGRPYNPAPGKERVEVVPEKQVGDVTVRSH